LLTVKQTNRQTKTGKNITSLAGINISLRRFSADTTRPSVHIDLFSRTLQELDRFANIIQA